MVAKEILYKFENVPTNIRIVLNIDIDGHVTLILMRGMGRIKAIIRTQRENERERKRESYREGDRVQESVESAGQRGKDGRGGG